MSQEDTISGQDRSGSRSPEPSGNESDPYRLIPSINEVADSPLLSGWSQRVPRSLIVEAARRVLADHRRILSDITGETTAPSLDMFARRVATQLEADQRPTLPTAINATGIIIHTGMGRAPLSETAVDAVTDAARHYAPVELDLQSGRRGKRSEILRNLLCSLTGAASATVVNNNAAALLITLTTIAKDRPVVVSRGELIEIGGSFRLPEVMAASGARLCEVGTTNKTRISDYAEAIDDSTAALMKVHTSNYQITGFTDSVSVNELVALAREHNLPVIHDIGSGALIDFGRFGLEGEPVAAQSIQAGADLVLFSGDKLLGGPQAGVIIGRRELVDQIENNPMMCAFRVGKLILTALAATLQLYRNTDLAEQELPVLAMIKTSVDALRGRAEKIAAILTTFNGVGEVEIVPTTAYVGGGSMPAQGLASLAVRVQPTGQSEAEFAERLRKGTPVIVPRVQVGSVLFDLRTVFPKQDADLIESVRMALVD